MSLNNWHWILRLKLPGVLLISGKLEVMYDISGKMTDLDRFNQQLAGSLVIDEFYYNK